MRQHGTIEERYEKSIKQKLHIRNQLQGMLDSGDPWAVKKAQKWWWITRIRPMSKAHISKSRLKRWQHAVEEAGAVQIRPGVWVSQAQRICDDKKMKTLHEFKAEDLRILKWLLTADAPGVILGFSRIRGRKSVKMDYNGMVLFIEVK